MNPRFSTSTDYPAPLIAIDGLTLIPIVNRAIVSYIRKTIAAVLNNKSLL